MSALERGAFREEDLVKVDESRTVHLASGGAMQVVCEEGDNVLCEFWDEESGRKKQALFDHRMLRRPVPYKTPS